MLNIESYIFVSFISENQAKLMHKEGGGEEEEETRQQTKTIEIESHQSFTDFHGINVMLFFLFAL